MQYEWKQIESCWALQVWFIIYNTIMREPGLVFSFIDFILLYFVYALIVIRGYETWLCVSQT